MSHLSEHQSDVEDDIEAHALINIGKLNCYIISMTYRYNFFSPVLWIKPRALCNARKALYH
jgi:hypothetical protein